MSLYQDACRQRAERHPEPQGQPQRRHRERRERRGQDGQGPQERLHRVQRVLKEGDQGVREKVQNVSFKISLQSCILEAILWLSILACFQGNLADN